MKKLLSLCLLLLTTIVVWAQEQEPTTFTVGNFKYTVTDEENDYVSIAKADEATLSGALVIPSSVSHEGATYAVTSVGASGFYETGITSVTIPSSVLTIGDYAFQNCGSITSITIEDSETPLSLAGTYGERPLWNPAATIYLGRDLNLTGEDVNFPLLSDATSVEFGPKVTTINPYLFSENSKLENLTIGNGVTTIGEYAFNSCGTYWDDETHQGVENLVVTMGSNVTTIGAHAFQNCGKLKSVTLPSTLTTIGNETFNRTGLTSISIPASVTSIGDFAFQSCDNMTSIRIEDSETPLSLAGTYSERPLWNPAATIYLGRDLNLTGEDVNFPLLSDATSVEFGPKVTTINPYLFSENSKLENLTIGNGVTTIGEYAFNSCGTYWDDETHQGVENLVVTMGSNVTTIGAHAFQNCGKLKSVTLPSTLTTIGNETFNRTGLTSISIPASVTSIGDFAFQSCDNMTSIRIEDSETPLSLAGTYSERPLWNSATTIYIGRNLTLTGEDVNYPLLENATSVEFGPQVSAIPNYLFSGVTTLSSVKVPWLTPITLNATTFHEDTYTNATLWVPGGTMDAYETATNWTSFVHKDFASFVVSITGSAHGTLAVGEISSTNNETATTLIDRGENAVFTVTPATGYELTNFTVNSVAQTPTAGQYTVEDLSADQTVVAGFTPIEYDLTLTLNDGTASNPATYTIETTTFTLNNPTKAGYDFAGWKLNGVGEAMMTVTIAKGSTGHLAYTATWTPIVYNIALTLDGGEAENPSTYTIESAAITLNNPTKTGHTFKGWKLNGEGVAMMEVTIAAGSTGHLAYTATWQVNQYTITFNSNGGTGIDAIKLDYGTEVEAPANPTRIGYTFAGWLPEVPATIPAEDITCVAQWTINQYTITFNTAGGSDIAPIVQDYATAVVAPANPTRDGYTFAGWDKDIPTNIPAENVTITATWTPVNYTISYELDGGNVDGVNPTSYTIESAPITLINPVKDGYDFAGWTGTGLDAATKNVIIATGNTGNRSYTATWTKKTYTVSITGGGVTADSYTPEYGDNVVLTIMDDPDATLTSLTVNGLEVKESIVDNQYTITSVSGNVSVVATWSSTKEFITLTTSTATFSCEQDLNFTGSELRAYIAAGYSKSENSVLLVRVYDVPANTGLVIRGEEGETYKISYSTSHSYFVNLLKEHLTSDDVPITSGDYNNYVLKRDADVYKWQRPTSGTMKLGTKKAYLQLPSSFMPAAARELNLVFEDDSTTDISKFVLLNNGKAGERIYNLNGQQVDNMRKGVYIVNGRKVMK